MTEQKEERKLCYCPYCDEELMSADLPFCQICKVTIFYCPECKKAVARESRVCIYCGAKIKS